MAGEAIAPSRSRSGPGGAGPGFGPERERARCARRFLITAGSCSVASSRSRGGTLGFPVEAVTDLKASLRDSDVCVTCTPSKRAFVARGGVRPGTFIAAVGADNQGKQELESALIAGATLVVDVLEQCAEIGELQHVLAAGLLTREQVHAELADVVAGRKAGRTRGDEITIFDSSGTALQDVAAAIAVYEKACALGRGTEVKLDA